MGKKWLGRVQAGLYGVVNGRFCIALLLVFVMECIMVDGTSEFLREWNLRITPWMLPHYFSDGLFRVYYGFIVCYMYADVPFMSRSEMLRVIRYGRFRWAVAKEGVIGLRSVLMAVWLWIWSVLLYIPHLTFSRDWGTAIRSLSYTLANTEKYAIWGGGSASILGRYEPIQALLLCMGLLVAVTVMIGLIMMMLSLYAGRTVAITAAMVLSGLAIDLSGRPMIMKLYYISPYTWLDVGCYDRQAFVINRYPGLQYVCSITGMLIIIFTIMIVMRMKRTEFKWNNEEA